MITRLHCHYLHGKAAETIAFLSWFKLAFPNVWPGKTGQAIGPRHCKLDLQVLTAEFGVDLDGCLRWGKPTVPCLWPVTNLFRLKTHWAEVQSYFVCVCVCEIMQLFCVESCVVKAVHKFYLRIDISETPNKWQPVEKRSSSDTDSCFWQDVCMFCPDCRR
jgi:hypothetical protein